MTIKLLDKSEAFDVMRRLGYTRIIVTFSGGNDEGGPDTIHAYDENEKCIDLKEDHYWGEGPRTEEDLLVRTVVEPIHDTYYSFAGDYYVSGTVTWTAETEEVDMDDNYESLNDYNDEADY